MKVLFTCGGTAGHINPAVALARMVQERNAGSQVLFVGAKGGMEERLVPKEGFPLETVTISSFWRSLSEASFSIEASSPYLFILFSVEAFFVQEEIPTRSATAQAIANVSIIMLCFIP